MVRFSSPTNDPFLTEKQVVPHRGTGRWSVRNEVRHLEEGVVVVKI